MKKFVPSILTAVIFAVVFGVWMYTTNEHESVLANQQIQIQDLMNQIETKKLTVQQSENEVKNQVTGLNMDRVEKDDKIVEEFLVQSMDWHSYDSYMDTRKSLMETYELKEDSSFLTTFFPAIEEIESPDGTKYNIIDDGTFGMPNGFNIQYSSMESHVVNIVNDVYSYLAEVDLKTELESGPSYSRCAFLYSVDGNGTLRGLSAYVLR